MTNKEKLDFITWHLDSLNELSECTGYKLKYKTKIRNQKIKDTIPHYLYKYRTCTNQNLKTLERQNAYFSSPKTWNDSLDVTVRYDFEKDSKIFHENLNNFISICSLYIIKRFISPLEINKYENEIDEITSLYKKVIVNDEKLDNDTLISLLEPKMGASDAITLSNILFKSIQELSNINNRTDKTGIFNLNNLRNEYLFYSLSESYDIDSQWATYANNCSGFCVCYEMVPKNKQEENLILDLLPIYYAKKEKILITELFLKIIKCENFNERIQLQNKLSHKLYSSLYTKTKSWKPEKEWRFCILNKNHLDGIEVDFNFATKIYLGEKISPYWKKRLINIARKQNLEVYERKFDKTKSNIKYVKIEI